MDWATHDHRTRTRPDAPAPTLVHTYWRVIGVSTTSRPVTCGLYRTASGFFEVRAGYTVDDVVRSQLVRTREAGDDVAAIWKMAATEKGFREIAAT